MFCRFCGNQISNDSKFCNRCGHILDSSNNNPFEKAMENSSNRILSQSDIRYVYYNELNCYNNVQKREETLNAARDSRSKLSNFTALISALSLVVFIVLYYKMAPGINKMKIVTYVFGVVIAVGIYIVFFIISRKKENIKLCRFAIGASIALIVLLLGLRLTYEIKKERVLADSISSNLMYIQLDTKTVLNPPKNASDKKHHTVIIIDGRTYENGDIYIAEAEKRVDLEIRCSYVMNGEQEKVRRHEIKNTAFPKGFTTTKSPNITIQFDDNLRAVVTLNFHRVCEFWEAVFY